MKKNYFDYENETINFKYCCYVIKILAIGCNKRFMWLQVDNDVVVCRISDKLYRSLKYVGVPTCQSLRGKKGDK